MEFGPFKLKAGDIIAGDATWTNADGNLIMAIGKSYGEFQGLITSGETDHLYEKLEVQEDGVYYIYLGNQNTSVNPVNEIKDSIILTK